MERPGTLATDLWQNLQGEGVVLLRNSFAQEPLKRLCEAATRCFAALDSGNPIPERYGFNPHAHSVRLAALLDFGIESEQALLAPLSTDWLGEMFSCLLGGPWRCRLKHSWARKKFAPRNAPASGYHIQDWHQDGALGAQFRPPLARRSPPQVWQPAGSR